MKKVLKVMVLLVILVFGLQLSVQADMGVPEIRNYTVKVTNPNGVDYVDGEGKVKGKLEYGQEVEISYETEMNEKKYGSFSLEGVHDLNYVCFDDIASVEEIYVSQNLKIEEPINRVVVAEEGVTIHKGPGMGYEKIGEVLPRGTEIVCYVEEGSYDNPWYYTSYDGVSGWVCELDALGTYQEASYLLTGEVKILERDEEGIPQEKAKIPANTIIKNPIVLDPWSQAYLIEYDGVWGYIGNDSIVYESEDITIYETPREIVIYDNYPDEFASTDFKEIGRIPANTKIAIKYSDYYGVRSYVSYNGIQGWIDEYDYTVDVESVQTTDLELPNFDNFTVVETPKLTAEVKEDVENKTEEVVESENPPLGDLAVSEDIVKGESSNKEEVITIEVTPEQIVAFGIVGAIVIALTCVVTIILINKTSKRKKNN